MADIQKNHPLKLKPLPTTPKLLSILTSPQNQEKYADFYRNIGQLLNTKNSDSHTFNAKKQQSTKISKLANRALQTCKPELQEQKPTALTEFTTYGYTTQPDSSAFIIKYNKYCHTKSYT
ncbi:hypothetical protein M758_8G089500 [Ceratodon purpureus]|nr:hypothetical protein M758_8G089500 [Ceratodon purpureus]